MMLMMLLTSKYVLINPLIADILIKYFLSTKYEKTIGKPSCLHDGSKNKQHNFHS